MPSVNTCPETGQTHNAPIGDVWDEADEIQSQPSQNQQRPPLHFVVASTTKHHKRFDSGSEWEEDFLHEHLEKHVDGARRNGTVLPDSFADSEYGGEICPDPSGRQAVAFGKRGQRSRGRKKYNRDISSISDSVDRGDDNAQDKHRHHHRRRSSTSRSRSISDVSESNSRDSGRRRRRHKSRSRSESRDSGRRRRRHKSRSRSESRESGRHRRHKGSISQSERSKSSRSKRRERRRHIRHRDGKKKQRRRLKKHVSFTVEAPEEQTNIDESERLSVYLDNAATRIQNKFRHFQLEKEESSSDSESEGTTQSESGDEGSAVEEMDPERLQHIITNVAVLVFSIAMMMKRWIVKCMNGCYGNQKRSARRRKNGNSDDEDPELVNPDEIAADGGEIIEDGEPGNMQGQTQTGPTTTGPTGPTP